jgi:hypothetical protein
MQVSPPPVVVQRGCRPIINYLRKLYDARASARLDLDGEQVIRWRMLTYSDVCYLRKLL